MNDAKTRRTLLPLLARTATAVTVAQQDASQQFCRVYLNVTVAGASLKVFFRGYPVAGGTPAVLNGGGVPITPHLAHRDTRVFPERASIRDRYARSVAHIGRHRFPCIGCDC
jgi:hypothetical protein